MDEKQMVPLRLPDFLFCHVLFDAMEYIPRFFRCTGLKADGDAALDVQASLAVGVSWDAVPSRCCAVCLRILQCDADFHRPRRDYHGAVQAP